MLLPKMARRAAASRLASALLRSRRSSRGAKRICRQGLRMAESPTNGGFFQHVIHQLQSGEPIRLMVQARAGGKWVIAKDVEDFDNMFKI